MRCWSAGQVAVELLGLLVKAACKGCERIAAFYSVVAYSKLWGQQLACGGVKVSAPSSKPLGSFAVSGAKFLFDPVR